MKKNKEKSLLIICKFILQTLSIFCCMLFLYIDKVDAANQDVSLKIIDLGNPFKKAPYARNVWDMQVFDRKIYLGHGNSTNQGSSPNAGPIPVIYYDPSSNKFITQYTVNEEQIDTYKIIDGKLYIPGHDSRESWDYGNYYYLDKNKWYKVRTMPNVIHVFDLSLFKGKLYSANGSSITNNEVMMSSDQGCTWISQMPQASESFRACQGYVHTLFQFKDKLYAVSEFVWFDPRFCKVLVMDGKSSTSQIISRQGMMPGTTGQYLYKMLRTNVFKDNLIYLGVQVCNVLQWSPDALYVAPQINQARRVALPVSVALPADILIRDNNTFILAYDKHSENQYTNYVFTSCDLKNWKELFRFNSDTFARSFEELNGDFYFGLGCEASPLSASSGNILRVPAYAYK